MLDLATSFLASVARDPEALAIVDGDVRLSYSAWYGKISGLVAGLDALGLKPGDHLVTVLQNRWEAATLHWACQFTGIVVTPLNWRSSAGAWSSPTSSRNSAARPDSPTSSGRDVTSSSRRSRARPSASCCAESSWRANTSPSAPPQCRAKA